MSSDANPNSDKKTPRWKDRLKASLRKDPKKVQQTQHVDDQSVHVQYRSVSDRLNLQSQASGVQSSHSTTNQNLSPTLSGQSLWSKAYAFKQTECPELIQDYEEILSAELQGVDTNSETLACLVERQMKKLETQRWKLHVGRRPLVIRELVGRLVKAVLYAKDFVTSIASSDPHASLAWAGVCVFLPLLCGPVEQDMALTEGLDEVCSVLYRFAVLERLYAGYCADPTSPGSKDPDMSRVMSQFEKNAVKVIAGAIEFQARVACYCNRTGARRYLRDVWKSDDWSSLSEQIRKDDARCQEYVDIIQADDLDNRMDVQARRLHHISTGVDDLLGLVQKKLPEIRAEFARIDERLSAEQKQRCHEALWTSNYENHKRVVGEAVPGTCKWFTSHNQYQNWKQQPSDGVLWLSADPGCGKSVIVRHIVEQDLDAIGGTVCYWFFRAGNPQQTRLDTALSAQLHQLFTQQPQLIKHALPRYAVKGKAFAGSVTDLWSTLVDASRDQSAGEIVMIFDALDECDRHDCKDLIRLVSRFYLENSAGTRKSRLKLMLTSRPYHTINREFHDLLSALPNIHLSADEETEAITQEINLVIDFRMLQIRRDLALTESTASALVMKMKDVGNRTYLWLTLMLDVIADRMETSRRKLNQMVDELPKTIHQAYEAILARSIDLVKARKIFSALLIGQRPFSVGEMSRLVAVGEASCDEEDDEAEPSHIFREKIRYICGLFVVIVDDQVFFLHETVREFLTSAEHNTSQSVLQPDFRLPLSKKESHLGMLALCSQVVLHESRRKTGRDHCSWLLLTYAATHWDSHYNRALRPQLCDKHGILDVLTARYDVVEDRVSHDPTAWTNVLRICRSISIWWVYRQDRFLQSDPAKWPVTVVLTCFGFDRLLDNYLGGASDPDEVDRMDCRGRTALSWACSLNRIGIVKVLLRHKATIDCYIVTGRSPYTYAASSEIQQLLDSTGSKSTLPEVERCNEMLKRALSRSDCVLVPELRYPLGHPRNMSSENSLQISSRSRLFRQFISSQRPLAEPSNSPSYLKLRDAIDSMSLTSLNQDIIEDDMNVLCFVAMQRRPDLLTMILERGVDVSYRGKVSRRDALSYAAQSGSSDCIRLLLAHGARVDRFDRRDRNALAYAIDSHAPDRDAAVRLLLEAEGDMGDLIRKLKDLQGLVGRPIQGDEDIDPGWRNFPGYRVARLNDDGTRTHMGFLPSRYRD